MPTSQSKEWIEAQGPSGAPSDASVGDTFAYLQGAPDALIVVATDGTIRFANAQFQSLFGYAPSEIHGQAVEELMPERFRADHREHVRRFVSAPSVRAMGSRLELWGRRKDGVEFPIEVSLSPVETSFGPEVLAAVRDATDRRQAEQSLAGILETSLNEIYIFDAATLRFIQVNRGARRNLGFSMVELRALTPIDIKQGFTAEQFRQLVEPLQSGSKEILVFEAVHRRKDGSLYHVEVHLQHSSFDGRPVFVAIILDVTERILSRRIERARQEALEAIAQGGTLSEILRSICVATEQQAPHLRIAISLGKASDRGLRLIAAPSLPESFRSATKAAVTGGSWAGLQSAQKAEKVVVVDLETVDVSANVRQASFDAGVRSIWAEPIVGPDSSVCGAIEGFLSERRRPNMHEEGLLRNAASLAAIAIEQDTARGRLQEAKDLLERRVRERTEDLRATLDQLRAAKTEAERADKTKTRFLAAASHDLRQPLQSLQLYLAAAERQSSREALGLTLGKMSKTLQSMDEMLSALLDIAKLDRGAVAPALRDVVLSEVIDRVVEDARPAASTKGLALRSSAPEVVIQTDPALLERIVENFVGNAIRYSENGTVDVAAEVDGEFVEIHVTDTGPGIPEDQLQSIFEEYYQLDNPNRSRNKGLGLGLAIARQLARLLGHELSVRSELGKGSTFSVRVPRGSEVLNEPAGDAPEAPSACVKRTVLIVDDDPDVADSTTLLLEVIGLEAHSAQSPQEALALVEAGVRPDVVITDYRLPGRSGTELLAELRKRLGWQVPGILVTGDTTRLRTRDSEAFRVPACAVLAKPVDVSELIQLISD